MSNDDVSTVVPAPGEAPATARALLALADHPHDVRTVNGGAAFEVPTAVAEAYIEQTSPPRGKRARKTTDSKEA